ncbi:NAD(P)H-binding protein [Winogradskyella bathintestinalis]|uniref:NAD(P)H-binding protein n=1 Tax=Winogradskyella bathintestinalis TaxID=3035208 RepID=A0ABT7ZRT5_9FLAO|nr:NAD(P)H-binding protein [Winogradskyella bathintestinalis]MDN3491721.1 NAD(P)H-binding protein [Winogradskyella bathintestinalis]
MKTQISVIGCGWLGLPLAKTLVHKGYTVHGSTTSKEKFKTLSNFKINPFLIVLNVLDLTGNTTEFLAGSETVIINIPPGLRKNPTKDHVAEIRHLMHAIEVSAVKHVLYISSTSVFKNTTDFPIITAETEPNATSDTSKQLIAIEKMLQANPNFKTTILRFGGLINEERHPAKFLSGRTQVSNPEAPINLIHKTDCIQIILSLIEQSIWGVTLNAAFPLHSTKKNYYSNYCKQHNLAVPNFNSSEESKGKIIDSSTLVQLLNYTFSMEL